MFSYKVVEKTLGRLHTITEDEVGAFRARIQHLKRLGLAPSNPGKGKRIAYSIEDVAVWTFALELAEFGIDPMVVKFMIDRTWNDVRSTLIDGNTQDVFFFASPNIIRRKTWLDAFFYRVIPADRLATRFSGATRVLILNLTDIHDQMIAALETVNREIGDL